jgi:hypothetical protein
MSNASKLVDSYLEEITLVSNEEAEDDDPGLRREIANGIINKAILTGKTNKVLCSKICKDERCRRDCDLRSTTIVIKSLQTGVSACSGDKGCIKIVMSRMINIAERGDSKVRMYGFGALYLRSAIAFANRMGFQAK